MTQRESNKKRQLGQSMVETALVLPVVLLLVFGVFELGRIVFVFSAINNASREAARFGAATGATGGGVPRYLNCHAIRQAAMDTAFLAGLTAGDIEIEYDTPVSGTMQVYGECDGGTPKFIGTDDIMTAADVRPGDRVRVTVNGRIDPILPIFPSFNPEFVTARTILKDVAIGPPECSDGVDNDGDGDIDYPDDSGCSSPDDPIEAICYRLSVVAFPDDGGTMSLNPSTNCANRYIEDTIVNLEAFIDLGNEGQLLPRPGFTFQRWDGPINTGDTVNPTTVTMDADKDVTAHFRPVEADLRVLKFASEDPVGADKEFYYTIDVRNDGPEDWAYQVIITDTLPVQLIYVGWRSDDGISCDESQVNDTPPILTCNLLWLEPGTSAKLYVDMRTPIVNGGPLNVENTVTVTATESDPDTSNNEMTIPGTVEPRAELSIEKVGPPGEVHAGDRFDYVISVTNDTGPSRATNVIVSDILDSNLTFVSSDDCTYEQFTLREVRCVIAEIPVGDTESVTFQVRAPSVGMEVPNTATVTSDGIEDDPSDNESTVVTTIVSVDLVLTKSAPGTATRNVPFLYTLEVTNNGPSPATAVTIVDTLPAGVEFNNSPTPAVSCGDSGGIVTCNLVGDIPVGGSRQVILDVTPVTAGTKLNEATVGSGIPDHDDSNNSAEASTVVMTNVALNVEKTATVASVDLNMEFSYTIAVQNSGLSTANNVQVVDDLPDEVEYVGLEDPNGWCNYNSASHRVSCAPPGGFLLGGQGTSLTVNVRAISEGTFTNTAALTSDDGSDSDSITVTVNPSFDLSLELTLAPPAEVVVGQQFSFELTVYNSGPSTVRNIVLEDILSSDVTYSQFTASVSAVGWDCSDTISGWVICTGAELQPLESVVIHVTVTASSTGEAQGNASVTADDINHDTNSGNNSLSHGTSVVNAPPP